MTVTFPIPCSMPLSIFHIHIQVPSSRASFGNNSGDVEISPEGARKKIVHPSSGSVFITICAFSPVSTLVVILNNVKPAAGICDGDSKVPCVGGNVPMAVGVAGSDGTTIGDVFIVVDWVEKNSGIMRSEPATTVTPKHKIQNPTVPKTK